MANVTIPVSLGSLQDAINVQAQNTTPADAVVEAGQAIVKAYKAYQELKTLTSPLSGLPESAPFPNNIKIEQIVVHCRVDNAPKVITLHTAQHVGDLYRLLKLETERLVGVMRTQSAAAQQNAAAIETACSRAQYVNNAQQGFGPE